MKACIMHKSTSIVLFLVCLGMSSHAANLLSNGSFEANPIGTIASYGPPGAIDTTTFTDWRFFTVGAPPIDLFQARIVDASDFSAGGTPGSHALRFDVVNTGTPVGADYALDRDSVRVPVSFGTAYTLSYDAVLYGVTGPGFSFTTTLAEYDSGGNFIGQSGFSPTLPTDALFHGYSFSWTPLNPNVAEVNLAFRPTSPGYLNAVGLDNISFSVIPEPSTVALGVAGGLAMFALRRRRA